MNETITTIMERRSIRAYEATPLTREEIQTLLTCGNWAPSAMNHQTTTMVATQDQTLLSELADAFGGNFYYKAPCVIFLFGNADGSRWVDFNAALVAQNICLAAQSIGLGTVQLGCIYDLMQSDDGAQWKTRLGVPAEADFCLAVAVGHAAMTPKTPARKEENMKIR